MLLKYCWNHCSYIQVWNFEDFVEVGCRRDGTVCSYESFEDQGCDLLCLPDLWWHCGIASWLLIARLSIEFSPETVRGASFIEEVVGVSSHNN
jgi:hypothetical protein